MLTDKAAREKQRRRGNDYICRVDLTPIRGVMFAVVFCIFCGLNAAIGHPRSVDLPKSRTAVPLRNANREDAINLMVARDNRVFLGNEMIDSSSQLASLIRAKLEKGSERRVYLRADCRSKFGTIRQTLATLRESGVEQISIVTRSERESYNVLRPE